MGRPMASPSPLSRKWALKSSSQASRPASLFRESRWFRSQRQETRERRKGTRFLPHTTHPDGAKSVPAALGPASSGWAVSCSQLSPRRPPLLPGTWSARPGARLAVRRCGRGACLPGWCPEGPLPSRQAQPPPAQGLARSARRPPGRPGPAAPSALAPSFLHRL